MVECQSNSFWNVTPSCPIVKAPSCTSPVIPELVLIPRQDSYSLGQNVEFSCQDDENEILIGPSRTVCSSLGNNTTGFVATPICQSNNKNISKLFYSIIFKKSNAALLHWIQIVICNLSLKMQSLQKEIQFS